ncbi:Proto-oncogene tyrosine-protein kinase ROS [Tetrabaena socialis]|uniref:Proto-oncogene tyrosine-protein kinase ROS n=1 Tax=Tetrabaena socialis TaxID=47790 RepID=A0A2J7ZK64_9CHLO|nr:Proto-oncogene tyrosine-protein kinase ROS [Tetrabaena socialis]|eukprot:PNH00653.1 Proto-oncogene tyrosine-protein kinase ROS [Tetrabaena socialis]
MGVTAELVGPPAVLVVRWAAPEVLAGGPLSEAGDVWSLAVTVWEVFANGAEPYARFDTRQVLPALRSGFRLERPRGCPLELWQLVLQCWAADPRDRPTFADIAATLRYWHESYVSSRVPSAAVVVDAGAGSGGAPRGAQGAAAGVLEAASAAAVAAGEQGGGGRGAAHPTGGAAASAQAAQRFTAGAAGAAAGDALRTGQGAPEPLSHPHRLKAGSALPAAQPALGSGGGDGDGGGDGGDRSAGEALRGGPQPPRLPSAASGAPAGDSGSGAVWAPLQPGLPPGVGGDGSGVWPSPQPPRVVTPSFADGPGGGGGGSSGWVGQFAPSSGTPGGGLVRAHFTTHMSFELTEPPIQPAITSGSSMAGGTSVASSSEQLYLTDPSALLSRHAPAHGARLGGASPTPGSAAAAGGRVARTVAALGGGRPASGTRHRDAAAAARVRTHPAATDAAARAATRPAATAAAAAAAAGCLPPPGSGSMEDSHSWERPSTQPPSTLIGASIFDESASLGGNPSHSSSGNGGGVGVAAGRAPQRDQRQQQEAQARPAAAAGLGSWLGADGLQQEGGAAVGRPGLSVLAPARSSPYVLIAELTAQLGGAAAPAPPAGRARVAALQMDALLPPLPKLHNPAASNPQPSSRPPQHTAFAPRPAASTSNGGGAAGRDPAVARWASAAAGAAGEAAPMTPDGLGGPHQASGSLPPGPPLSSLMPAAFGSEAFASISPEPSEPLPTAYGAAARGPGMAGVAESPRERRAAVDAGAPLAPETGAAKGTLVTAAAAARARARPQPHQPHPAARARRCSNGSQANGPARLHGYAAAAESAGTGARGVGSGSSGAADTTPRTISSGPARLQDAARGAARPRAASPGASAAHSPFSTGSGLSPTRQAGGNSGNGASSGGGGVGSGGSDGGDGTRVQQVAGHPAASPLSGRSVADTPIARVAAAAPGLEAAAAAAAGGSGGGGAGRYAVVRDLFDDGDLSGPTPYGGTADELLDSPSTLPVRGTPAGSAAAAAAQQQQQQQGGLVSPAVGAATKAQRAMGAFVPQPQRGDSAGGSGGDDPDGALALPLPPQAVRAPQLAEVRPLLVTRGAVEGGGVLEGPRDALGQDAAAAGAKGSQPQQPGVERLTQAGRAWAARGGGAAEGQAPPLWDRRAEEAAAGGLAEGGGGGSGGGSDSAAPASPVSEAGPDERDLDAEREAINSYLKTWQTLQLQQEWDW